MRKHISFIIAVLALATVVVFTFTQRVTNNRTFHNIHRAEQKACIGTNINRAVKNKSSFIAYKGLKQSVDFSKSQLNSQVAALQKIGLDPKVLAAAVRESKIQLQSQENQLNSLFWIQLEDCSGSGLLSQNVVLYTFQQQFPPKTQTSVTNATHVTPKGVPVAVERNPQ